MLKINKILSKTIKSPLSLRGAKQRSNLSGFSLIELMVAAAILAFIVFGIFQAYSTSFMGMADARDRTVATNYAREAMEDIKNMDFEEMTTTTKSVIDANRKYRVDVNVSIESENLKEISTVVSWKDRNGITKTIDTSMLVHFIEIFASDAAKIVLFTESYNVLNSFTAPEYEEYTSTELTAVIKDIKGNTIIDWGENPNEGPISFLIISVNKFGTLSDDVVTPINGRAYTTFTSDGSMSGNFGINVIEASVYLPDAGITVTDTTTIKITNGPVKIILEPNPEMIKANITNYSVITASLVDAAGVTLEKKGIFESREITFHVSGEGNLSTSTITIPFDSGDPSAASAEIILNSTGNPGLVSVFATATDLVSDKTDVLFLGTPVAISISANPNPMYLDDDHSTISVSLLDINGFITSPSTGPITIILGLTTDTNGEILPDSILSFASSETEVEVLTREFRGQTITGTADITASGGGLEASITITVISAIIPEIIKVTASSLNVKADGLESSIIKATIYDGGGKIVTNYDGNIEFTISNNTSSAIFLTDSTVPVNNGFAEIEIVSSSSGNATVYIVNPDPANLTIEPSEGIVIGFYGAPNSIELTADPTEVYGEEASVITAVIYDDDDPANIVTGIPITFTTDNGTFSNGEDEITITPADGVATTELSSSGVLGVANIEVSAISVALTDSATVTFYEEINLLLVGTPTYNPTDKTVTFNVRVTGKSIDIDEMKVSWVDSSASERLSEISMKIPHDNGVEVDVYNGNVKSGESVDIDDQELPLTGESAIKLTFVKDMLGKMISVVFYPPITGSYSIEPFLVE